MEKRFVIFLISAVAVLAGSAWLSSHFAPRPAPKAPAASAPATAPVDRVDSVDKLDKVAKRSATAPKALPERRVDVRTGQLQLQFTSRGAQVSSWKLPEFREHQKDPAPVELVPSTPTAMAEPAYGVVDLPGSDLATREWVLDTPQPQVDSQGRQSVSFSTTWGGVAFRKTFHVPAKGYEVQVDLEAASAQAAALKGLSLQWGPGLGQPNEEDRSNVLAAAVRADDKVQRVGASKTDQVQRYGGKPGWAALHNHYFTLVLIPGEGPWAGETVAQEALSLRAGLEAAASAGPAQPLRLTATLFGGPKEYALLKSFGLHLERVVSLGWFEFLAVPMLYLLKWLFLVTHNYGLAILLLTILIKAVVWFPTHKSMTSMRHMQRAMAQMKPRLDSLKETYKNDPQKLNQATMALYKEYGVNPLGGCLPMLLQMPILFALYSCFNGSFEMRGASFVWLWTDLSVKDPTYILPLAMGLTMFIQQKMTPTAASATPEQAQQQKMMMWMMPIMLTVMAIWTGWPTGLLLYWTCSNLLSMVQQAYINKTVPA